MPRSPRRPRRAARAGTLRLLLVLFALVGINVYFLGLRGGTSIGALLHNAHVRGAPAATEMAPKPIVKLAPLPEDPPGGYIVDGALADGQTIAQALTPRLGHSRAVSLEKLVGERVDLAALRAGQEYTLVYDIDDRLTGFDLRVTPTLAYHVELGARRSSIVAIEGRSETRVVGLSLPAGPPLWDALRKAGEGAALGERLCELFSSEAELTGAAVPPGERLRMLVEKRMVGGRLLRYGHVIAAEWSARAGVRRAFYFAGTQPGYFTERGESVDRKLRLAPFRALRATSPVQRDAPRALRTAKASDSALTPTVTVDIPVPQGGSPAVACAPSDGTITVMSRTPAGTTLTIQAEGGRFTYANLARLAPGLHTGQRVLRGQALGRVEIVLGVTCEGATGLCDCHTLAPRLSSLTQAERPRFGELIAPLIERLRQLSVRSYDPLAARSLSAMP
jgi:hypothetical protein